MADEIPNDAPFIHADPERKNKIVLVAGSFSVTAQQFDRIKKWFELQFFVTGDVPPVAGRPGIMRTEPAANAATPAIHEQHDPVLIRTPATEPLPGQRVPDSV